jgi:hypothetical protein
MKTRDRHFKGQQESEKLICFFRHHWIVLVREFIYFSIFAAASTLGLLNINKIIDILQGNYELKLLFLTAFLIGTLFIHRFFIKLLNYYVNIGIITDIRIIDHDKTIFFRDTMDSIDISQIQNIEQIKEGIFPSIFHFGDIKVFMTASSATKTFHFVPNAQYHFRCLNRQKEARQLQLRVHSSPKNNDQTIRPPLKHETQSTHS